MAAINIWQGVLVVLTFCQTTVKSNTWFPGHQLDYSPDHRCWLMKHESMRGHGRFDGQGKIGHKMYKIDNM